jgi:hypothetical protein
LAYVSGTYYVIKRVLAICHPLDERLSWGQGEDVIFSQALSKSGILFECNPFSTVSLLKEKGSFEREIPEEVFIYLCKWVESFGEVTFQKQCHFQESWVSSILLPKHKQNV